MSDTIRIKISQKSSPRSQSPELTLSRRKRRVVNSEDDYDEGNEDVAMREVGIQLQRPVTKRARRSYSAADSMDVDIEGGIEVDAAPKATTMKPTNKPISGKKRRAAVLSSDEEDNGDDEFIDAATQSTHRDRQGSSPLPSLDLSDADYDYDLPAAHSKPVRRKNPTWKVRDAGGTAVGTGNGGRTEQGTKPAGGGAGGGSKAGKGKGKVVKKGSKEIMVKNEKKGSNTPTVKPRRETSTPPTLPQGRAQSKDAQSRSRPQPRMKEVEDEVDADVVPIDIVNDPAPPSSPVPLSKKEDPPSLPSAPAAAPASAIPPAPPKKVKLPPIRKNKPPGTVTSTPLQSQNPTHAKPPPASSSSAPALATSEKPATGAQGVTGAAAAGTRKTPATADFDLRDKSAWASIFKHTGGSTPRSGLSRREKEEERRKELHKMRDEARAKRNEALKQTFDLQASWDKISRFEERLRANRSSALYPNLFAAKFRDEWEAERKRARDRERERERAREREARASKEDVEMEDGRERRDERGHRDDRERGHA